MTFTTESLKPGAFSPARSSQSVTTSEAVTEAATDWAAQSNLTVAQQQLWLGQKLAPDSPLYNMAFLFTISGEIDPSHFQAAFKALVQNCDALRTVIEEVGGIPQQQVLDQVGYALPVLDFSEERKPQTAVRDWAKARARSLFSLSERLFNTALIRLRPDCFIWYLNQHHLITDIESFKLLFEKMGEYYQRSVAGELEQAPGLPAYTDIVTTPVSATAAAYWQQQQPQAVALYHRTASQISTRTHRVSCELGLERTAALKALALKSEAVALTPTLSSFNLVAGLLLAYLYRISSQGEETPRKVAIATPAQGRPTAAHKETVGLFIELFPLLAEVGPDDTFATLLSKVSEASGLLLRRAQPGASEFVQGRDVNVVLNFIHTKISDFAGYATQAEWIHAGAGDPGHHLRLQVHDFDDSGSLQLHFDFNEEIFDRALQARAPSHFLALVDAVLANHTQPISAVNLIGQAEQTHLSSLGHCEPPHTTTVLETVVAQFESQVEKTPEAIALTCGSQTLTYGQLNTRANQLAHYLQKQGITTDTPVAICLRRSPEMLVAICAVLKAGGAYVPLDPGHPAQRIAHILQDTQAGWVLTHSELAHSQLTDRLDGPAKRLCLDTLDLASEPEDNLSVEDSLEHLAYLLYTSGSTGQPKGVAIEHLELANYVQWAIQTYVKGRVLSFPLFSPLTFDLTVTSIYVPLLSGGQVVIYPETDDPIDLSLQRIFQENVVDVIKLTPSHLALVKGMIIGSRVKTLILGGEDLKTDLAKEIVGRGNHAIEIYNEYGPTEATVGCMIHRFDSSEPEQASVPIGRPAANAEIYLLDEQLNTVPQGSVGEIYIGGPGLARGYLNRPELTAARFVEHAGQRLYRTGDLGRWLTSDVLAYLGRRDRQVKIRGHRIELGEVEAAVAAHPAVRASVVTVVQPAGQPVNQMAESSQSVALSYCTSCGLASNYPGIEFDTHGVCDICRTYETYRHRTQQYFKSSDELKIKLEKGRTLKTGDYDCMMLLSGGKDSTYALAQLVHMGYKVFAFTLDNGYISEGAKSNIRRVVEALGVDHVFGTTPAMNEIFVDSLERHCNVCNGCFKTIYTLSMKLAYEMGIACIVTGLSRGQFFETRLSEEWFTELFGQSEFDPDKIDETILEARKVYHRSQDAVSQFMDVEVFKTDDIFEAIEIVDFYRYCDVELAEMLAFLRDRLPWIRPADTGRSTNCLINNAGIYVHTQQRGYHNYALPYSWDVRMGHKTVDECIDELNDEIDVGEVKQILKEIGFDSQRSTEAQLAAFYVLEDVPEREDAPVSPSEMRQFLSQQLPNSLVPAYLIPLEKMPLTVNGKADLAALPNPRARRPETASTFVAPKSEIEKQLAQLWQQVLSIGRIGRHDNFFELGGDSIMAIQIAARMAEAGMVISPNQIFQYATLAELAAIAVPKTVAVETASERVNSAGDSPPQKDFSLPQISSSQLDKLSTLLDQADSVAEGQS